MGKIHKNHGNNMTRVKIDAKTINDFDAGNIDFRRKIRDAIRDAIRDEQSKWRSMEKTVLAVLRQETATVPQEKLAVYSTNRRDVS